MGGRKEVLFQIIFISLTLGGRAPPPPPTPLGHGTSTRTPCWRSRNSPCNHGIAGTGNVTYVVLRRRICGVFDVGRRVRYVVYGIVGSKGSWGLGVIRRGGLYAATGTSMLRSSPSELPELTFLPVLAMTWRTFSYSSSGPATTVAVWSSRETS